MASSMTALSVWLLERLEVTVSGGSRNGLCSSRGVFLMTGVCGADISETSSNVLLTLDLDDGLRLLPTRTTCARTAVAVFALVALFRKVEPTLKVLSAGLGGCLGAYFFRSTAGTGGAAKPSLEPLLPIDLTLTMAALARMPVWAGVTTTPALPYIVDATLDLGAYEVRANDVRSV